MSAEVTFETTIERNEEGCYHALQVRVRATIYEGADGALYADIDPIAWLLALPGLTWRLDATGRAPATIELTEAERAALESAALQAL